MRLSHRFTRLDGLLALALALAPVGLAAQSTTSGTVSGTILSPSGSPIPRALVTLTALAAGSSQEATTGNSGAFTMGLVATGSYEIRVEAVGYRPLVARTLTIGGGERRSVTLTINPAPPPVLAVDTITLGASSSTRWRAGGVQLSGAEVEDLPYRFGDLASIAALASAFDESLGAQGLPGDLTLVIADGVPFYRAPHPTARAEQLPDGLFPRSALAGVTAFHNAPDVEWAGAAGGYVALATRTSTRDGGLEFDAAYSGDPVWSSSELDITAPSLVSIQGGARKTFALKPDTSYLVLSGEALRHQTPLGSRLPSDASIDLTGLDPDLVTSLMEPSVETVARYSGLARLDILKSTASRIFFRGAGSYSQREFDGPGPLTLAGSATPPEASFDFSAAGGIVSDYSSSLTFEFRAGVSGSYREFDPAATETAAAFLAGVGAPLGILPSGQGTSSRTDVVVLPTLRHTTGAGVLKGGASIRATSFTMSHSPSGLGDFFYSDTAALLAGQGFGVSTTAPEESFSAVEYGLFAQYDSELAPGLRFTLGARYDHERIGTGDAELNTDWLTTSGLPNAGAPSGFHQFGGRGSITWDPSANGSTRLFLTGSLHQGDVDPRVIYQLLSQDTDATATRYAGAGLDWPGGSVPAAAPALPTLTLLGPDTRPPRSALASVGVSQRLGSGLSLYVGGTFRRTDFLMRRRNLNIPVVAQAVDVYGRDVFGTLQQDGSLITTTADDARRFPAFAEVWALDPDGWSEYKGMTASLEHSSRSVDFYGSYTYSETTDNWVGASKGSVGGSLSPLVSVDGEAIDAWTVGTSDFDVPHRVAAGLTVRLGAATLSGIYRFRSGLPFTPRYRAGVDANGDGSVRNDIAFVPGDAQLATLLDAWPCLSDQADRFAVRNSCRGPAQHSVDVRLAIRLGRLGGREASIVLDGFNLVEGSGGVIDDALLLVDPAGSITTSSDGSMVTLPVSVNPDFGRVLYPSTRGRMIRVGLRIG